jgi:hypothetical protein
MRLTMIAVVLLGALARAQSQPESEWSTFGGDAGVVSPPPAPEVQPLPLSPTPLPTRNVSPPPLTTQPTYTSPLVTRRYHPEPPNTVSVLGAPTLGQWNRGEAVSIGFPLITLRFLLGLTDRFDLGVGFDSYYGLMNEPVLVARVGLVKGTSWSFSAVADVGYAWFVVTAPRENKGPRWLTGRRNINFSPGVILSYQDVRPRSARLFFEGRYLLALDTEPFTTDPLSGVPPPVVPGSNVVVRGGAEVPLSAKTSFVFSLGLTFHGRSNDAVAMPEASVGIVTSF